MHPSRGNEPLNDGAGSNDPTAITPRADSGSRPGEHIGPYKLLELIGEGGFGFVWLAERRSPFVQRVALKVIKPGMDSRGVIARFDQERQALAVMDHPNVARVLDGGISAPEQGSRPYFVMEYVRGEPITAYCDRNRLTLRERLELFIPVCEAVQHAHHKGIIHRDLKPTNVLVTVVEGRLTPKVIDFGVAKAMSHTLTHHTILTEHGQLIGTPEYMSPEQAEMGGTDVDTRTDVYSLGVLLYELLAGRLPFEPATLRSAALDEVRRIIREEEPPKPSTRLTTLDAEAAAAIARQRQSDRGDLAAALRRELDWIPLRAMRKDRSRRYGTPGALAEDIRRYLDDRPVEAAPESRAYLLKKFVRRHKGGFVASAAVITALVLGIVVSLVFMAKAEQRRLEAEEATREAQRQTMLARQRYDDLVREKTRAERVAEMVSLLAKAQQELHAGNEEEEWRNYYTLVRRLDSGYLAEAMEEDFAIRQAFAATASKSTDGEFHEDAHRALTQAVERATEVLGPAHATTIELLRNAMVVASHARDFDAAERWASERIQALRRAHSGESNDAVEGMLDLAGIMTARGDEARAESTLLAAYGLISRLPFASMATSDRAFDALREHYHQRGRYGEETAVALEHAERWFSFDGRFADQELATAARRLERVSYFEGARRCWEALADMRARMDGDNHWTVHLARSALGGSLLELGRFAEAEPFLTASAASLRGSLDVGSRAAIDVYERVVRMYELWSKDDAAKIADLEHWRDELAAVRLEQADLDQQRERAKAQRSRASTLNQNAWYTVRFAKAAAADAEGVLKAIEQAAEAVSLAHDSLSRAHFLNTLGVAQFRAGLYAEAIDSLTRSDAAYQHQQLANAVFIAMAHQRLGQHQQAAAARASYESLRGKPGQYGPREEHDAWHAEFLADFGLADSPASSPP